MLSICWQNVNPETKSKSKKQYQNPENNSKIQTRKNRQHFDNILPTCFPQHFQLSLYKQYIKDNISLVWAQTKKQHFRNISATFLGMVGAVRFSFLFSGIGEVVAETFPKYFRNISREGGGSQLFVFLLGLVRWWGGWASTLAKCWQYVVKMLSFAKC